MSGDEKTLPAALQQLATAIASLIDPRPETDNNQTRWCESVYDELREAIQGHRAGSSHGPPESRPPVWVDGIDLKKDIDDTVKTWLLNPTGPQHPTVNRLRALANRKWRPQDTETITEYSNRITAWVKRYSTLVDQKPLSLPNPCPKCSKQFAYHRQDGEQIRSYALQITVERCVCLACRVEWPAEQFPWLARLLGYQPLEGVIG